MAFSKSRSKALEPQLSTDAPPSQTSIDEKRPAIKSTGPRQQKFDNVFESFVKKRIMVLLTFVFSAIIFPLALISLIAGMNQGMMEEYAIGRLNMSLAFEDAIVVTTNTNTKRDILPQLVELLPIPTTAPAVDGRRLSPELNQRGIVDDLNMLGLPNPFAAASTTTSATSSISGTNIAIVSSTTSSATSTNAAEGGIGGFFSSVGSAIQTGISNTLTSDFNSVVDNITDSLGTQLEDGAADFGDDVRSSLGIQQWYSVHLLSYCVGNFTPNSTAPSPGIEVTNCTSFFNLNLGTSNTSGDHFTIGDITVDYSALDVPNKLSGISGGLPAVVRFIDALYAIAIATSGLMILISPVAYFTASRLLIRTLFVFSLLCNVGLLGGSVVTTAVLGVASSLINALGDGLGIEVSKGDKFLAITWTATAFALLQSLFWTFQVMYYRNLKRRQLIAELRAQIGPREAERLDPSTAPDYI